MESFLTILRPGDVSFARDWCRRHGVDLIEYPDIYAGQNLFVMRDPASGLRSSRTVTLEEAKGPFLICPMLSEMLAEIRGTEEETHDQV